MTRRHFLAQTGAVLSVRGATQPSYREEMPDMLVAHVTGKLAGLAEKWDLERDKIKTPTQLEARNRFVREKFREMIHGYPERNPLEPVVVASHQRQGYRLENVMFQSRPHFWVTGNLYIPQGAGPFPGIISPCGHYPNARMEPEYQFAYMNLVRSGFVVLAYDPVGQGERRQYWNPQTDETEAALNSIYEHSMPGQLLLLMGEDLTHYRIWDGMRAIDYLLTRPEIDGQRIGCAGHSGGGTLTMFISALDERVRCAVVNQGGTGHRWPASPRAGGRIGPSDVEQNLFPAAIYGADLCDLLVAIAPRPLMAMIEDYSPHFNRAAEHIRKRYQLLGVPEKFTTEEATDPHAWTVKLRLSATDWFCRWFHNRRGPDREPDFQPEPMETLYCTPNGSVRYSQTGQTIFSLILKKQEMLPPKRSSPPGASEIASVLRYRRVEHPLEARLLVTTPRKGYRVEKLEFLSEPRIYVPTWVFLPENRSGRMPATLYVHEGGKEREGREFGALEKLVREGQLVVAVDVRGVGATAPSYAPSIDRANEYGHLFNVETALTYMTWFMDESLFGMRVQDVVRSVDYTLSRQDVDASSLRVVGVGAGALWAMYAAALDPRIQSVVAQNGLLSYRTLTRVDRYLHGAGIFVRDVLTHFDLPQVAAALGDRLTVISPVDAMKKPVALAEARATYGDRIRVTSG